MLSSSAASWARSGRGTFTSVSLSAGHGLRCCQRVTIPGALVATVAPVAAGKRKPGGTVFTVPPGMMPSAGRGESAGRGTGRTRGRWPQAMLVGGQGLPADAFPGVARGGPVGGGDPVGLQPKRAEQQVPHPPREQVVPP